MDLLPVEILAEIFQWYCHGSDFSLINWLEWNDDAITDTHILDITAGPWLLSYVSSHWRAIALSTPPIWSSLRFRYVALYPIGWHQLLTTAIQRSAMHPLRIWFSPHAWDGSDDEDADWDEEPPVQLLWLRLLMVHSPRWEDVHLHLRNDDLTQSLSVLEGKLPIIRSLSLNLPVFGSPFTCFIDAPLLDTFTILNSYLNLIHLPYVQLKSVTLSPYVGGLALLQAYHILSECPNLEHLRVVYKDITHEGAFTSLPNPVIARHLRRLDIELVGDPIQLGCFSAPALEELRITWVTDIQHARSSSDLHVCS